MSENTKPPTPQDWDTSIRELQRKVRESYERIQPSRGPLPPLKERLRLAEISAQLQGLRSITPTNPTVIK